MALALRLVLQQPPDHFRLVLDQELLRPLGLDRRPQVFVVERQREVGERLPLDSQSVDRILQDRLQLVQAFLDGHLLERVLQHATKAPLHLQPSLQLLCKVLHNLRVLPDRRQLVSRTGESEADHTARRCVSHAERRAGRHRAVLG